jgi:spermidine/putrescine transport system substrate-binding protein
MSTSFSRRQFMSNASKLGLASVSLGGATAFLQACGGDDDDSGGSSSGGTASHVTIRQTGWAGQYDPIWVTPLQRDENVTIAFKGAVNMPALSQLLINAPKATYDVVGTYAISETGTLVDHELLSPLSESDFPVSEMVPIARPSDSPRRQSIYNDELYYIDARLDYEGLVHNTEHVDPAELESKGYSVLLDPKYKGKIAVWDSYQQGMAMMAVILGYEYPWKLTNAQFDKLRKALIDFRKQVFLVSGFADALSAFSNGTAWMVGNFMGDAGGSVLRKSGLPASVHYDPSGTLVSHEGYSVMATSKERERAHEVVKWFYEPKNMAALVQQKAYFSSPVLPSAYELLPQAVKDSSFLKLVGNDYEPKAGRFENIIDWIDPIEPKTEVWLQAWADFKSA